MKTIVGALLTAGKAYRDQIPRRRREGGWTFVETIIVIAIVLVLTSSVGFMAFRYVDRARIVAARSQIEDYSLALHSYFLDNNRYPTSDQGLEALWTRPNLDPIPRDWQGPYVSRAIAPDPWGNQYQYQQPGPNGLPFGLSSLGADGTPGGTGNNADITSWGTE